jgi:hypothetical protein
MAHDESSHTCNCGGTCSCQHDEEIEQVFLTREEYVVQLEDYLVQLKKEITSVEETLAQLKQTAPLAG